MFLYCKFKVYRGKIDLFNVVYFLYGKVGFRIYVFDF